MVSCKQCQTPNSLDSTFCKKCGAELGEIELNEARAKLDKLVEEGNALFNQGRTEEALAIAEAAVGANPSSTSALSLKTLCHERRGEIAAALECAERLVELNPDSDFDKIRRNTLRQKLQSDLHVPATPDRRLAVVGATAAVVFVLCVGAILARMTANANAGKPLAMDESASRTPLTAPPTSSIPQSQPQPTPQTQTNPSATENPGRGPQTSDDVPALGNGARSSNDRTDLRLPKSPGGMLPGPDELGATGMTTIEPIKPDVTGLVSSGPKLPSQPKTTPNVSEDPVTVQPTDHKNPGANALKEEPGVIEITTHRGGGRTGGGGIEPSGNGLEALLRVGSQQYQLGNYAGAAKSYEQALRNGGDPIVLNKRLGQAYNNLGRSSDAAEAYRKCISAIDAAIATGRGNRDSLASTREVCAQALKVLGG